MNIDKLIIGVDYGTDSVRPVIVNTRNGKGSEQINPQVARLKNALINKNYERKHGPGSYYGQ